MNFKASLTAIAVVATLGACGGDDGGVAVRDGGGTINADSGARDAGNTGGEAGHTISDASTTQSDAGTQPADASTRGDAGSMDASTDAGGRDAAVDSAVHDSGTGNDAGNHAGDAGVGGTMTACQQCEAKWCTKVHFADGQYGMPSETISDITQLCSTLQGNASAGPKVGTPRSQLCMDLVACSQRTRCAKSSYLDCLCGEDDYATCHSEAVPSLKGACRNEFLAAAETTDWGDLDSRLNMEVFSGEGSATDPSFTTGAADTWIECDRLFCNSDCNAVCDGVPEGTACSADDTTVVCANGKCPIAEAAYGGDGFFVEDVSVYDGGM